jgi:hypothetical protein
LCGVVFRHVVVQESIILIGIGLFVVLRDSLGLIRVLRIIIIIISLCNTFWNIGVIHINLVVHTSLVLLQHPDIIRVIISIIVNKSST